MQLRMKFKTLLMYFICLILGLTSCKKDKPFTIDETSITTIYWDIPDLPETATSTNLTLVGEVGGNRDIDSVKVTTNVNGKISKTVTLHKSDLTLEDRKDWPTSTIKWYKINYKPKTSLETDDEVSFTLMAYSPFGASQDLRTVNSTVAVIK